MVAEGRVRTISVWEVRTTSEAWRRVATEIARVRLPERTGPPPRPRRLPPRLGHLFWSVPHPEDIDVGTQGEFVAYRLLSSNDPQALAWAATNLPPSALRGATRFRGMDDRTRALAENLAR
jgi:hypothetical protein